MITTIRPNEFFNSLKDRMVVYWIPKEKGEISGTITSLDTLCLIAAIRIYKLNSMLELGTGMGYTSNQLDQNTDISITTVDKDSNPVVFKAPWISRVQSDIRDFTPEYNYDFVFCDINYTHETLKRETDIAFSCSPKVVAWHDYGHPDSPQVKEFLESLYLPLIHIRSSYLAFWLKDGLK